MARRSREKNFKKGLVAAGIFAAVLFLGALLLGGDLRDGQADPSFETASVSGSVEAPANPALPASSAKSTAESHQPGDGCSGHDHGSGAADPALEGTAKLGDPREAAARLRQLLAGWDGDLENPEALSALSDFAAERLHALSLSPREVVEFLKSETEPVLIDLLGGALAAFEPSFEDPAVREALSSMAAHDSDANRRQTAIVLLGGLVDETGQAAGILLDLAARERKEGLRLAAIAALGEHARRNPGAAGQVERSLTELVRSGPADVFRAQALGALDLYEAAPETIEAVGGALEPGASLELRFAAVSALGGAGPVHRQAVLGRLEAAYAREEEPGLRSAMVYEIVRAGRNRALEVLRRLPETDADLRRDIEDYVGILESEEVDLEKILERKSRLDMGRVGSDVTIEEE